MSIMIKAEWSLSEVSRLLKVPQHRLIHLCEKKAVTPDFEDAHGRGTNRRFSPRNVLEFAVALKMRELMIPVGPIASVLHVLREFERLMAQQIPGFRLPESLVEPSAPEISVIITDGPRLYFELRQKDEARVYGGVQLDELMLVGRRGAGGRKKKPPASTGRADSSSAARLGAGHGSLKTDEKARLVVSVTRIAKNIDLRG